MSLHLVGVPINLVQYGSAWGTGSSIVITILKLTEMKNSLGLILDTRRRQYHYESTGWETAMGNATAKYPINDPYYMVIVHQSGEVIDYGQRIQKFGMGGGP